MHVRRGSRNLQHFTVIPHHFFNHIDIGVNKSHQRATESFNNRFQMVGKKPVIIVQIADNVAPTTAQSGIPCPSDTIRERQLNQLNTAIRIPPLDNAAHVNAAVIDDNRLPVLVTLCHQRIQRPRQKPRAILGWHDDTDNRVSRPATVSREVGLVFHRPQIPLARLRKWPPCIWPVSAPSNIRLVRAGFGKRVFNATRRHII